MDEEVGEDAPELPLPESFLDFLNDNGLDPSIYAASQSTPRYIRYPSTKNSDNYLCACAFIFLLEFLWDNVSMLKSIRFFKCYFMRI